MSYEELEEDATYTAQSYFEASKSQDLWGRVVVFLPALVAAACSLLVAMGQNKVWSAPGAVSATVAATASFLGSGRKAEKFLSSARRFTVLRHQARLERTLLLAGGPLDHALEELRRLRGEYDLAVKESDPVPNRHFKRAQRRIKRGDLAYSPSQSTTP
jgi:hypothetical protein